MQEGLSKGMEHGEKVLSDIVAALCSLIESRDVETSRHIERLPRFCRLLAEELSKNAFKGQIDGEFLDTLPLACTLHDIGKAQIPSYILMKPTALSPDEREILSSHTTYGAALLAQLLWKHPESRLLRMAREITLSHHERWDATGYPEGLGETEIPLAARIVAVANIYDVLRSAQVYKSAMTHEEALFTISTDFRGRYDPEVVKALFEVGDQMRQVYDSYES